VTVRNGVRGRAMGVFARYRPVDLQGLIRAGGIDMPAVWCVKVRQSSKSLELELKFVGLA